MNWPPNFRPFTSVLRLKEMFGAVEAVVVVVVVEVGVVFSAAVSD